MRNARSSLGVASVDHSPVVQVANHRGPLLAGLEHVHLANGPERRESAIGLASEGWPRDVCAPCAKELAREEEKRSPRFSVLHGSYEAYCTQVNQVRATPSAGR